MKKLIILALTILVVCLTFAACSCEHQYEGKITTEASCSAVGIKTFTCATCNDSYTEEIPLVDHTYGSETVTKSPTCTEEGEKSATCKVCGTTKVVGSVSKLQHQYDSKVTKESTCMDEGVKTYSCSECSHSYTEAIAKLSHTYSSKVTTAATCTTAGVKTYTCQGCSDSYTEAIAKLSHTYSSKVTTAATCTTAGVKTYTCQGCSDSYTEAVSAKGHNYTTKTNTSATCTTSGTVTHTCKSCGDSYTDSIPATGHEWINATCTNAKYCSSCGEASGSALGHTTNNGICSRCNETINPYSITLKTNLPYTCNYHYSLTGASSSVQITRLLSTTFSSSGDRLTVKLQGTIIDPVDSTGSAWVKVKLTCPDGTTRTKETHERGDAGDTVVFNIYFYDLAGDAGEYIIEIQNYYK